MITGQHEGRGRQYRYTPDPYGRWIVGAQMLPTIEDDAYGTREQRQRAADALHQLAVTAGQNGALAREPVYDHLIGQLRRTVPSTALPAWDLLVSMSANLVPNPAAGLALADALAEAALNAEPLLNPADRLGRLRVPVVLLHGRQDRLVPFTESLRLADMLPAVVPRRVTITRLLGHAKMQDAGTPLNPLSFAAEARRFVATIHDLLARLTG
jgi:pimeloyl-ACP methyl ester carboxylesterase